MPDVKTAEQLAAEKIELEAKAKADAEVTAKKAEAEKKANDNKGDTYYQDKLKEAERLISEQKELIANKNRAIDAEKERRRKAEEKPTFDQEAFADKLKADLIESLKGEMPNKEEILNEARAIISEKDVEAEIKKYAKTPEAEKLVRLHYEALKGSALYPTLSDKVMNAAILANKEVILGQAKMQGKEEERENLMAQFTGSKSVGGKEGGEANEILDAMSKYSPERVAKAKKYL